MKLRLPLLLTAGFRLFFLAAAMSASASMAAWVLWLGLHDLGTGIRSPTFSMAPHQWHGHELVFGYGAAVMAGFFLTAVPGWTGTKAASARYLGAIGSIWLLGRASIWFSGFLPASMVAAADLAFLPGLCIPLAIDLWRAGKPQNFALLGLPALVMLANILVHLEWCGVSGDTARPGLWLGILAISALISVIGGRVTPAFTRNALIRGGHTEGLPASSPMLDRTGIGLAVLIGPMVVVGLPDALLGLTAMAAGIANAGRLARWRPFAAIRDPLLLALHLGFSMLILGYFVLAVSWLGGPIHPASAIHMLAAGAIGGMSMAMMTRAPLGHTGRPLRAGRAAILAYGLIAMAAIVRAFGTAFVPGHYFEVMYAAGIAWVGAFLLYLVSYWKVLTGPSAD